MKTITIKAESRQLQRCASKEAYRQLDSVFYRNGYAFGTNGHMLAIRLTTEEEPQDLALVLPMPTKKVADIGLRVVEGSNILVSIDGSFTANTVDAQAPNVKQVLESIKLCGTQAIRITINAKYLLELAKTMGADSDPTCPITLELNPHALNQGILVATKGSTTLGVLMPIKGEAFPSDLLAPILAAMK